MDSSGVMGFNKSVRMMVQIDVRNPLMKQMKLKLRNGIEEYFNVKYEKPPLYVFYCGKIGHGIKDCDECRDVEEPMNKYEAWLKASPWMKRINI
ncbi:hypothetical protein RDABS01_004252 [Bienertia sinuspersici]